LKIGQGLRGVLGRQYGVPMATFRAVEGLHTSKSGTLHGWYVERSERDKDPDIVSPLLETQMEAEAQAKRRNEEEPVPPHA
jgi:hypothetical protein